MKFEQLLERAGSEVKGMPQAESKANEVVNTSNNSEWYSEYGVLNSVKDLTFQEGALSLFAEGNEGNNLPVTYDVPYDTLNYKMKAKTEWTNSAHPAAANKAMTSAKATISQKGLIAQFGLSDEMLAHSSDARISEFVQRKAAESFRNSALNMLINGDTVTAATGNVNSDDLAPATTFADGAADDSLLLNGLRKAAIGNSNTFDVTAFDADKMISVRKLLGDQYKNDLASLAVLWNADTWLTALTDDAIKLAINTSQTAAIDGGMPNLWGMRSASSAYMRLTEADGKESGATPANNTKGQFLVFVPKAVRHGFGQDAKLEVERVAGYGYQITVSAQWGFTILDSANTVAAGINVAV